MSKVTGKTQNTALFNSLLKTIKQNTRINVPLLGINDRKLDTSSPVIEINALVLEQFKTGLKYLHWS